MAASANHRNSLETILTYENRDASDWSVIWSTAHIPGMDNAFGGRRPGLRIAGRRRLRIGALVLGGLLTMHCRVSASALTGGLFVFIILLTLVIAGIANPMRHFEVYLGQWSISGPGRVNILEHWRLFEQGGIPLLESVEAIMTGVAVPYICCLELTAMLCVYRSHDFVSDMNVATEENACSSRIGVQWNLLTLLTLATLGLKVFSLVYAEFPSTAMYLAIAPLAGVLAAVPVRACNNAYVFLRPSPRQGT
ncbi:putative taurine transporter [Operophtera brumata]|uniref:Putative taurine transporter n=1 Tax=Operophtera brumata TaxID=104452 RepID=A0A0L7KPB8_OPEBR|nr:putative taurine transporter [Operophtera brumata]